MSQPAAAELIRQIVTGEREAGPEDIERIVATMAHAPFSTELSPVPVRLRLTYQGITLSRQAPVAAAPSGQARDR